jgi:hypothetical protein
MQVGLEVWSRKVTDCRDAYICWLSHACHAQNQ